MEQLPPVVSKRQRPVRTVDDLFRDKRDLPTAAWAIHDIMGNGHSRRVPSERRDNVEPGLNGRSKVTGSLGKVGLEKLVGPTSLAEEPMIDLPYGRWRIIDALEQNHLVGCRDPRVS